MALEKSEIVSVISRWDRELFTEKHITLCSSATTGSLAILNYLKTMQGIETIAFETPSYFASVRQAELLGFNVHLLPTFYENSFHASLEQIKCLPGKKALWITQPRYGLGSNNCIGYLEAQLNCLSSSDRLIIDEATEQIEPSPLRRVSPINDQRIMKIRNPFKSIGVNGPRIAVLIHSSKATDALRLCREQVQGSIDVFSLRFASQIFADPNRYFGLLRATNKFVIDSYNSLAVRALGSTLTVLPFENGYIGSVAIDIQKSEDSYTQKREKLLAYCGENRMPVILGANMRFAIDPEREYVRIN